MTLRKKMQNVFCAYVKQLMWLKIVHSGYWCLRLALCIPSGGACQKWMNNDEYAIRSADTKALEWIWYINLCGVQIMKRTVMTHVVVCRRSIGQSQCFFHALLFWHPGCWVPCDDRRWNLGIPQSLCESDTAPILWCHNWTNDTVGCQRLMGSS